MEQGTPEWLQARAGKITASKIADVMAKGKSGEAAVRRNYRAQIVTEIITGSPAGATFTNDAMRRGTEQEPYARAAYEVKRGVLVDQVGMVLHHSNDRFAASPDGIVGDEGLVEIKCPNTATHLEYLLAGDVPSDYQPQMLWQMACTGRKWCDFVSFDPRLPDHLQLFVKRMERDDKRIEEMEEHGRKFFVEVDELIDRLRKLGKEEA